MNKPTVQIAWACGAVSDVAFLISYVLAAEFMVEALLEFSCSLTSFGSEGYW